MDRTTASMNRRARVTSIHATTIALSGTTAKKSRKYSTPALEVDQEPDSALFSESRGSSNPSLKSSRAATKVLENRT